MNIVMVASENDALQDAKVGGIGDVVRDVPPVLASMGCLVSTVIPSYGYLHEVRGAEAVKSLGFSFAGEPTEASLYKVPAKPTRAHPGVTHYVVHHPDLVSRNEHGKPEIYHADPESRPFATDATRFALFCAAVAEATTQGGFAAPDRLLPDCLHLHDWHAGLLLLLREYHEDYRDLKGVRTVYTIHNLALQGVRPIGSDKDDVSALERWYPGLPYKPDMIQDLRWPDCENPTEVGIRLADAVHVVSPTYASEIVKPSDPPRFIGGEGLESFLRDAQTDGRLFGILNGCDYPPDRRATKLEFPALVDTLRAYVLRQPWKGKAETLSPVYDKLTRLAHLPERPQVVLTSVSRVADQKMYLLIEAGRTAQTKSALERILDGLGGRGIYIMLGTGNREYEQFLVEVAARYENFVFLQGFSNDCANALYAAGDLFLMPSSFEPCGISQMLAMRDGQPCVAHAVGGLQDTIKDGENGFLFKGDTAEEQADAFVSRCLDAIDLMFTRPDYWKQVCTSASEARFLWEDSARQYKAYLYTSQQPSSVGASS
jgi:starch synthase